MIIEYNNVLEDGCPLYPAVEEIETLVIRASQTIYNISALCNTNPKFYQWIYSAQKYIYENIIDNFIYARYGYAVEEYTNLNMFKINFLAGYTYNLQENRGGTRPDIIIYKKEGDESKEIAWLDITSENSVGHIKRKAGAGWDKAPFVAELLYPSLNLNEINVGGDGIGWRAASLSAVRCSDKERRRLLQFMINCTDKVLIESHNRVVYYNELITLFSQAFNYNFRNVIFPHGAINSILNKYINCDMGSYTNTAAEFINYFYKNHRQRGSTANRIIAESYNNRRIFDKIYLEQSEIDELLG